jgi:hypothetical protein
MTNLRLWLTDYAAMLQRVISDPKIGGAEWEAANQRFTEVTSYLRRGDEPKRVPFLSESAEISKDAWSSLEPSCAHEDQQGWGDTEGFGEMWCKKCGAKTRDNPRPPGNRTG